MLKQNFRGGELEWIISIFHFFKARKEKQNYVKELKVHVSIIAVSALSYLKK